MAWMEIQEGKVPMRSKEYARALGVTAACVKRAIILVGKFFEMIPPTTGNTPADVDMYEQETEVDVGINCASSEIDSENGKDLELEDSRLHGDIGAAVAALSRLAASGRSSATNEASSASQGSSTAPDRAGGATETPVEESPDTVSCCVCIVLSV